MNTTDFRQAGPAAWRSVLYVPGDNTRALEKARTLDADAVILDLEDAVAPEHKAQARQNVAQALQQRWPGQVLLRVNSPSSPWQADDLALLNTAGEALGGVVLPKVETGHEVSHWQRRAEAVTARSAPPVWAMIETPLGVLNSAAVAALPGVGGLIAGTNDLALGLRLPATPAADRLGLLHALSQVVLAARAYGKVPLDAVYNQIQDEAGFLTECRQGRMLGFAGKTVIHPGQIAGANAVYGVGEAAAQEARDLLAAWEQARASGRSVTTFRGRLIEQLHADAAVADLRLWDAAQRPSKP